MARSLNKVMIIGYVADEPNVRDFANGNKVANFTVATNEWVRSSGQNGGDQGGNYNNQQSQGNEITEWHRLSAWGRTADMIQSYIHKGSHVYAEGKLRTRSYVDKNDIKRSTTEIVVDTVIMLDRKGTGNGQYNQNGQAADNQGWSGGDGYSPYGGGSQSAPQGGNYQSQNGNYNGGYNNGSNNYQSQGAWGGNQGQGSNYNPYNGGQGGNQGGQGSYGSNMNYGNNMNQNAYMNQPPKGNMENMSNQPQGSNFNQFSNQQPNASQNVQPNGGAGMSEKEDEIPF